MSKWNCLYVKEWKRAWILRSVSNPELVWKFLNSKCPKMLVPIQTIFLYHLSVDVSDNHYKLSIERYKVFMMLSIDSRRRTRLFEIRKLIFLAMVTKVVQNSVVNNSFRGWALDLRFWCYVLPMHHGYWPISWDFNIMHHILYFKISIITT